MRKKIKWSLISVGSIVILFIGYYIISVVSSLNHIGTVKPPFVFESPPPNIVSGTSVPVATIEPPPEWEGTERVNILVLGADARGLEKNGKEVPRSDSMMVVSIEPTTKKALLISILRDTYVKIPGHNFNRINVAMEQGGPDLAMKTVSDLLDIPIQYYVYMDFKGFIGVVDALGGVSIDVEKDMDWEDAEDDHIYDIHLKQGFQEMDGKTALQYVRFRYDARSDYARSERQRKFLTAISERMQTTSGILKFPKILAAVDPYIYTNIDNLSEKLKLGSLGFAAKSSGFVGIQVPPPHLLRETRINNDSVLTTDPELLKAYIQDKFIESLTGVEQPLAHMKSIPSDIKATAKPVQTAKPNISPAPSPSGDPSIAATPSPSKGTNELQSPAASIKPTETPLAAIPTPSSIPKETSIPTAKPVIQAGG
jgi:LCP family protein required for cell wall assembly